MRAPLLQNWSVCCKKCEHWWIKLCMLNSEERHNQVSSLLLYGWFILNSGGKCAALVRPLRVHYMVEQKGLLWSWMQKKKQIKVNICSILETYRSIEHLTAKRVELFLIKNNDMKNCRRADLQNETDLLVDIWYFNINPFLPFLLK